MAVVEDSFHCPVHFAQKCSKLYWDLRLCSCQMPTGPSSVQAQSATSPRKSRASEIMQYGYPGFDNLRTFEDFVLSYDRRNRLLLQQNRLIKR